MRGEIFEFMEYRQKLEKELDSIKGKITDVEDELDVRKILIERCIHLQTISGRNVSTFNFFFLSSMLEKPTMQQLFSDKKKSLSLCLAI